MISSLWILAATAIQVWSYSEGTLYQLYSAPGRLSDVALEPGEKLASVSAGDTVRWVIGDTTSGEGAAERVHILVKPTQADAKTNLVIHTNRRTYHIELTATPDSWIAAASWDYPRVATRKAQTEPAAQRLATTAIDRLNFRYDIKGPLVPWRPLRAFDDGEKTYIQFPPDIAQHDMPPLFLVGPKNTTELLNYRVQSPYYIVDRLFDTAELRLGAKKAKPVRITASRRK
jgi:type IV secretion system protein VirB9